MTQYCCRIHLRNFSFRYNAFIPPPAHDAFTRLLSRLEPDAETLWREAKTQIDFNSGILVLDDSTLEKPYSEFNALVYRH